MGKEVSERRRTKAFISYARQDKKWLEHLKEHLKALTRESDLDIWEDTQITAGDRWQEEIGTALESTKVAILLISRHYLASEFIAKNELPPMLAAEEKAGVKIFQVICGRSLIEKMKDLSVFQFVNPPNRPLNTLSEDGRDKVFIEVAELIQEALDFTDVERSEKTRSVAAPGEDSDHGPSADGTEEYSTEAEQKLGPVGVTFLDDNRLTNDELSHLKKLKAEGPFEYEYRYSFQQELRRLLALGLIEENENKPLQEAMKDERSDRDLKEYFYVTDKGMLYLSYL